MPGEKTKGPANPVNPTIPMNSTNPTIPVLPMPSEIGSAKKEPGQSSKKEIAKKGEPKKDEPQRVPIELQHSRRVITWVNRTDGKNDLDRVHCEGKVVITQKPTPENKNGVRIEGTTVDLEHYLEGNNLIVAGNEEMVGQVHFDTIAIVANDINIDQRRNEARVKGGGWMQLQSATKLVQDDSKPKKDGVKNKQPAKSQPEKKEEKSPPIEIEWDDSMELEGPTGWVLLKEMSRRGKKRDSKCENMQVKLDRPVWLNNANRPPAKPGEPKDSPQVERACAIRRSR